MQKVWDTEKERLRKLKQEQEEEEAERRRHAEAERLAAQTPGPLHQKGAEKDLDDGIEEFMKNREEYQDMEEAAKKRKIFEAQPYLIEETSFPGSKFFDTTHHAGNAILEYNMTHGFFMYIYELLDELTDPERDEDTPERVAEELKVMIDLLIISYARAEGNFADGTILKSEEFHDQMRNYWGQFLISYINHRDSEQS